jgi:8-amino-7-oxononanoate synthase
LILESRLLKRHKSGNLRRLQLLQRPLVDFASNDYLALARSQDLAALVAAEHQAVPLSLGSTGSRLLTGNSLYAEQLEARIAKFHGYEAGLLFNCGYMANIGLLSAVARPEDTIIFDAAIHASMHDGMRLSRAKAFPFRHNDLGHLQQRLQNASAKHQRYICIESLYSTDGSIAPLREICRLAKEYEARLMVDEAHAVGTAGPQGRGLVAEQGLREAVFAQVVTFGKALGVHGAIVLGSELLKHYLVNFATSYIYTTALPRQMLSAISCSYALFPHMECQRQQLKRLIQLFRQACPDASFAQIQAVRIQGNVAVKEAARQLKVSGFDVRPLMSPTVKQGHESLRICLHAFNSEQELLQLINYIKGNGMLCTESL